MGESRAEGRESRVETSEQADESDAGLPLRIDVVTLFPEMFAALSHSIVGRAIEQGFGKAPVFCREGGSIPVVSTFQEELGVPAVLFGVGLPDENAHAPNERLDLSNFHNGIVASAILYKEIAAVKN